MSYNNPYSTPEKFGLITVGEIDFSDGCYNYDTTVVLRRVSDGVFFHLSDAGCSCPSPFEDTKLSDLTEITSLHDFKEFLYSRCRTGEDRQMEIVNLVERLHTAGVR